MNEHDLIKHLNNAMADLEKAQMRGINAEHKSLLIFTAYRTITHLRNTLLTTTEGEANEETKPQP